MALSGTLKINIDVDEGELEKAKKSMKELDKTGKTLEGTGKGIGASFKSIFSQVVAGSLLTSGLSAIHSGLKSLTSELSTGVAAWNNFDANMKGIGWPQSEIDSAKSSIQSFAEQTVYSSLDISDAFSAMVQGAHLSSDAAMDVVHGFGAIASSANNPKQAMGNLIDLYNGFNTTLNRIDFRQVSTALNGNTAQIEKQLNAVKGTNATWSEFSSGSVKVTKEEFQKALALAGTNKELMKNATQYKSATQALDGLKESATNALTPLWNSISQVGIKVFSDLSNSIKNIKIPVLSTAQIDSIAFAIEKVIKAAGHVSKSVGNAFMSMLKPFAEGKGGVEGLATAIGNLADKISSIPPGVLEGIVKSILAMTVASKGIQASVGIFNLLSAAVGAVKYAFGGLKNAINVSKALVGIAKGSKSAGYALQFMGKESKLAASALKGFAFKDGITSVVAKIATSFGKLTALLAPVGSFITGMFSSLMTFLTPVVTFLMGILQAVGALVGAGAAAGAAIIAAIAAVVAALVWFFGFTETGRGIVKKAWDGIKSAIESVADWFTGTLVPALASAWETIKQGWSALVGVAQTVWNGIVAVVSPVIAFFMSTVVPLFQAIGNLIVSVFNLILAIGQMVWRVLMQVISIAITYIWTIITTFLSAIYTAWNTAWSAIFDFLSATWSWISSVVMAGINFVLSIIQSMLAVISGIWNSAWSAISAYLGPIWSAIQSMISSAINAVKDVIQTGMDAIKGIWDAIWESLSGVVQSVMDKVSGIVQGAVDFISGIIGGITDAINGIAGAVDGVTGFFSSIGKLGFEIKGNYAEYPNYDNQLVYAGVKVPETFSFGAQNVNGRSFDKVGKKTLKAHQADEKNKREIYIQLNGKTIAKETVEEITKLQKIKEKRN